MSTESFSSWGLFNKKKKPFSIAGQESSFFPPPGGMGIDPAGYGADQGGAGVGLSGTGRWGSDIKGGGGTDQTKEMLEALGELTFDDPTPSNLGKPGGTGGGGFKLFPNSMVENRTPIGPFDEDEQRKRWWAMYGKIA